MVHPAGAVTGSSSLMTIEATMTWPVAVPDGRFSVMLLRAFDDPLDDDPTRAIPAPAGVGGTGANTATRRPAIRTAARRVGGVGHLPGEDRPGPPGAGTPNRWGVDPGDRLEQRRRVGVPGLGQHGG